LLPVSFLDFHVVIIVFRVPTLVVAGKKLEQQTIQVKIKTAALSYEQIGAAGMVSGARL